MAKADVAHADNCSIIWVMIDYRLINIPLSVSSCFPEKNKNMKTSFSERTFL
jgi:hypothetical protein